MWHVMPTQHLERYLKGLLILKLKRKSIANVWWVVLLWPKVKRSVAHSLLQQHFFTFASLFCTQCEWRWTFLIFVVLKSLMSCNISKSYLLKTLECIAVQWGESAGIWSPLKQGQKMECSKNNSESRAALSRWIDYSHWIYVYFNTSLLLPFNCRSKMIFDLINTDSL